MGSAIFMNGSFNKRQLCCTSLRIVFCRLIQTLVPHLPYLTCDKCSGNISISLYAKIIREVHMEEISKAIFPFQMVTVTSIMPEHFCKVQWAASRKQLKPGLLVFKFSGTK